ncbi:MAG: branched-chain amino acid ABC transporter permease [Deinococcales bacterium]
MGQYIADGIVLGATLALGAIGLTLTFKILRFANFAHGELLTFGAYFALALASVMAFGGPIGTLTFGWGFILVIVLAAALTAVLAIVVDILVYRVLRRSDIVATIVIASFGASLMLRNVVVLFWGPQPEYYSTTIAIAKPILPGVRVTTDEIFVVVLAAVLMVALHLFLTRTPMGKAMRAVSDNTLLAQVTGVNVTNIIRLVWIVGGSLAAVAGVFYGITVQVGPNMGFNLILPMFAAAILGGIGSVYGAVLGGMVIGLAESISVFWIDPAYKPAVAFLLMFVMLLVYPSGLLGERA